MPKEPNSNRETQQTQPKKGKPATIPVPTRKDVFRDLEKVAKPRKRPESEGQSEGRPSDS